MKKFLLALVAFFSFYGAGATSAAADDASVANSLVGVQGYDLVSYHSNSGPRHGNGNHVLIHGGVSYLFATKANKKAFAKNPEKYLPAYGGFCAYGAAVGKKFVGDPTVWKVVDSTLYLNLDAKVQSIWNKDIPGNIAKADSNWTTIKNVPADQL